MLQTRKIKEVVAKAVSGILSRHGAAIHDVMAEPTVDLDGRDALSVTLVIARGTFDKVTGDDFGDIRLAISRALHQAHEDRFAFLTYTTEEELEDVAESGC